VSFRARAWASTDPPQSLWWLMSLFWSSRYVTTSTRLWMAAQTSGLSVPASFSTSVGSFGDQLFDARQVAAHPPP